MHFKKYDHFKVTKPFYDGYRLLSTLDRNKEKPEIYISTSNRTAGKSVFFNGLMIHKNIQQGNKFLLLCRNKYECPYAAESFFKTVENLFFPLLQIESETLIENVLWSMNLYVKTDEKKEKKHLGYITALSACEQIKKCSNVLAEVDYILFDEFMSETGNYLPKEPEKLASIHTSAARGGGKMARYLPCILIGNLIDICNPYYETLGVVDSMQLSAKFYRGNGFVIEQGFNEAAATAHEQSAFNRAFSGSDYNAMLNQKAYLQTSYQFIDSSIADIGYYVGTIRYKGVNYSCRYNEQAQFYYINTTPDPSYRFIHAATLEDVDASAAFDPANRTRKKLKEAMQLDFVRFKNMKCRDCFMHFITGK